METSFDKWDLLGSIGLIIPAIFLFLSLFSDAPWLQPKWGRKFGRPAAVPLSRLSRVLWLLLIAFFAAGLCAKAFHYDVKKLDGVALPTFFVIFVLIILSAIRDGRAFARITTKAASSLRL